ncbi:hypothetical protein PIB30_011993 [Stylosanthes scabra]|uniref:Uncharacterized protein n=1 Tax=Stylosanthes scabra TaxID=79078 RepID=A0ABU6X3D5_9FABA|nr:hypothetical protein [Stylosanthes scabra]
MRFLVILFMQLKIPPLPNSPTSNYEDVLPIMLRTTTPLIVQLEGIDTLLKGIDTLDVQRKVFALWGPFQLQIVVQKVFLGLDQFARALFLFKIRAQFLHIPATIVRSPFPNQAISINSLRINGPVLERTQICNPLGSVCTDGAQCYVGGACKRSRRAERRRRHYKVVVELSSSALLWRGEFVDARRRLFTALRLDGGIIRMERELISRESIKPSKPTPSHNRIHQLSFIDHIVARNYVPAIYFYPCSNNDNNAASATEEEVTTKISMLKKSLSKVLTIYYPFAGIYRDQRSIHCNDQGVTFIVSTVKTNLSYVLNDPSDSLLNPLFPDDLQWKDMGSHAAILAIQINRFACGGIAIAVCLSHKLGDGSTLFNFVNDWATLNRNNNDQLLFPPDLVAGSSLFPQEDLPVFPEISFTKQNTVCARLVFEGSKIESLKETAKSNGVENPSRVEVVIGMIYKRAVSSLGLDGNGNAAPLLLVAANLRRRMVPPLPEKSIGNWVWSFPVVSKEKELVEEMREGLSEFCEKSVKKFGDKEFVIEFLRKATTARKSPIGSEKMRVFFFASWCRVPTYEVDFGWGKAAWVTSVGSPVKNSVVLMDGRDGNGVEALVSMEEQDLVLFLRDYQLLQYASINPKVHV